VEREYRAELEAERDQRQAEREDYRAKIGLSRFSASRGLDELQRAGLVSIDRTPGRSPVVIILEDGAGSDRPLKRGAGGSVG
jgi:hypothetical protein